jgi:hypothetical protein
MHVRWKLILLSAITLVCLASRTQAAPVTSGYVQGSVNGDFYAQIDLAGDGFSLTCSNPRCPTIWPTSAQTPLNPWVPSGKPVDLSSYFIPGQTGASSLVWQGVSYQATPEFIFTSPVVVASPGQVVTVPFTFSGYVTTSGPTLSLTGQGITTATYAADLRLIRFDFASPLSLAPSLDLATVSAMPPTLLNALRECGMCAVSRDLGVMANGRRGVEFTPLSGGFLSGPVVMEMDPAGGPARLVNPEPTTAVLLLTGALLLILQRTAVREKL